MAYYESAVGSAARQRLEGQGFFFPAKPADRVEIPDDITSMPDEDLMEVFANFTAWADYATAQVGLAVVAERTAEREVETAEAQGWATVPPKTPVAAGKGYVGAIPEVRAAREAYDHAYAYRRLVYDMAERFERDAALLSRELTRRTSDHRGGSRGERTRP